MPARDSFDQAALPLPGGGTLPGRIPDGGAAARALRRVAGMGAAARRMVARLLLCGLPLLGVAEHAAGQTVSGFRSSFHRPAGHAKPSAPPTPVATPAPYIQAIPLDGEEAHPAGDTSLTFRPVPTPHRAPQPSRRGRPRVGLMHRGALPAAAIPPAAALPAPALPARVSALPAPPPPATAQAGRQAPTHQRLPLAHRISPHPLAPPDLGLIRALAGWPVGVFAVIALALWLLGSRRRGKALAEAPAALPCPPAFERPPAEPRLPRRADCPPALPEPAPARQIEPIASAEPLPAPPHAARRGRAPTASAPASGSQAAQQRKARGKPPRPLDETLALQFEALRFSATLVHAVLQYRLCVTNGGKSALGPLRIALDMIAADASLGERHLSAEAAATLPEQHTLPSLAPGETSDVRGELRLALKAITPLRVGMAALMVPLVRLKIEAEVGQKPGKRAAGKQAGGLTRLAQFVVGEPDESGEGKLHPYQLDLGPRSWPAAAQAGLDLVA